MRAAGVVAMVGLVGCGRVVGLQPKAPATMAVADRAADFTLPSHTGERVSLATMLAARDVVLVFYRGHW